MTSWPALLAVLLSACTSSSASGGDSSVRILDFRPGSIVPGTFGTSAELSSDGMLRVQSQGNPCATTPKSVVVQGDAIVIDYAQTAVPCWSSLTTYVTTLQLSERLIRSQNLTVRGIHQQSGQSDFEIDARR